VLPSFFNQLNPTSCEMSSTGFPGLLHVIVCVGMGACWTKPTDDNDSSPLPYFDRKKMSKGIDIACIIPVRSRSCDDGVEMVWQTTSEALVHFARSPLRIFKSGVGSFYGKYLLHACAKHGPERPRACEMHMRVKEVDPINIHFIMEYKCESTTTWPHPPLLINLSYRDVNTKVLLQLMHKCMDDLIPADLVKILVGYWGLVNTVNETLPWEGLPDYLTIEWTANWKLAESYESCGCHLEPFSEPLWIVK
jgi:hypothetical protein